MAMTTPLQPQGSVAQQSSGSGSTQACNYCGRENAPGVLECAGCGTPFENKRDESSSPQPPALPNSLRAAAEKNMLYGALWCLGGLAMTGGTYVMAVTGWANGTYIVAWGAILFGGIQFLRGWTGRNEKANPDDEAYAELEHAANLETAGRVREALAAYELIVKHYPDTAAARDAQKSIESLMAR
jgi:hypothetical protein